MRMSRSENMRHIRSKNTSPEIKVRKLVYSLGFRGYRIHRKDLPGKPDLAWIGRKLAIFVHGCFWHGHTCKEGIRKPKTNQDYWIPKIENNKKRDLEHSLKLEANNWRVLVVWECELKNIVVLTERLSDFLGLDMENKVK